MIKAHRWLKQALSYLSSWMFDSWLSWQSLHLTAHLLDWILPYTRGSVCPACVCNTAEPIVVERVPEAVTSALNFAQQQCLSPSSAAAAGSSSCWSFSLFWLGVAVGLLVTVVFCLLLSAGHRAWQRLIAGSSEEDPRATAPRPSTSQRVQAITDGEPANPRTLRQLGIVR